MTLRCERSGVTGAAPDGGAPQDPGAAAGVPGGDGVRAARGVGDRGGYRVGAQDRRLLPLSQRQRRLPPPERHRPVPGPRDPRPLTLRPETPDSRP
eukprot:3932733-Rhodomonas_salina.1